jgi:hypothetical protein
VGLDVDPPERAPRTRRAALKARGTTPAAAGAAAVEAAEAAREDIAPPVTLSPTLVLSAGPVTDQPAGAKLRAFHVEGAAGKHLASGRILYGARQGQDWHNVTWNNPAPPPGPRGIVEVAMARAARAWPAGGGVERLQMTRDGAVPIEPARTPIVPTTEPLTGTSYGTPPTTVGGADPAALADAAAGDGATFVKGSDRARAHIRQPPPKPRKAGPVEVPEGIAAAIGAPCSLLVGKDRHAGAFVVVEVAALVTSHDARTLAVEPRYPAGVQERDYTGDAYERRKVQDNAARMIPDYLINNNPDSVNGPPVVAVDGGTLVVMGGNSRAMSLRLAYEDGHAKGYRALLVERAGVFGLSPADVEPFAAPALVRVVAVEVTRDMSRALNESQTLDKSSTVDALSASSRLSTTSRAILGEQIDPDGTLDAYLSSIRARPFVASLLRDRVITPSEAPRLLLGPDLSEEGRDHVRRILIASIIPDAVTIDRMRPSLRDLVARITPALLDARHYGHDLTPDLVPAVEDLADAAARGVDVERLDDQGDMFAGGTRSRSRTPEALTLRALLGTPRTAVRALRVFASLARQSPAGQPDLETREPRSTAALLASSLAAVGAS